ncbi:MAG: ABC transporter substrate-binding protein, partial [Duodenibacillus sp.]
FTFALFLAFSGAVCAQTLKIGTLPAADSIVLEVAVEEGLFQKEGLDVKTVPFKSALEVGAAMRAGRIDGHFGDLMNVFVQNETGAPQAVVLTTTHTTRAQRAFGLVVSPKFADRITGLDKLSATPTAMSASTIIDYLLDRMTSTENLPASALKKTEVRQIPIRLQMLLSGQIETALLPEPLVSVVEQKGGRVIWDDRGLNEALAVVALKKTTLTDDVVRGFRRAVASAAQRIEENPEKYRALMVQKRLLPKPAAPSYTMVRFSLFGTADGLPPLPKAEEVKRVGGWMLERGMIKSQPSYDAVVWERP